MDIIKLAKHEEARLIAYRRYLHEHPELSGQEVHTLAYIKTQLSAFQIPFIEVFNGGILATIDSQQAGKTVLLRADIDALPINEDPLNGKGYPKTCVSQIPGVQHACGHDAHTAALLVAGKLLNEQRQAFRGKVVLCFEQGEEGNGNIFYLLKYFEDHHCHFDSCFGIHVGSFVEGDAGAIVVKAGPFMAGMTSFKVTLTGKGGHGSRPDLANNPLDCFAGIYQSIAALRMKQIAPLEPLTYSIGYVQAGTKNNIIPDQVRFGGTIRYFNAQTGGKRFWQAMQQVIEQTAQAYDCQVCYDEVFIPGYPVINNPDCADIATIAFSELFADVETAEPQLGTESFSFYQQQTPGVFAVLCTCNEQKGITAGNHTAQFDIDESVLYKAVCCHMAYALAFLNGDQPISFQPNPHSVAEILSDCGKTL